MKKGQGVDFQITQEQFRLQQRCLERAADFATRSAQHDREASHPIENYDRLRAEGFLHLTVPKQWGGTGHDLLTPAEMRSGVKAWEKLPDPFPAWGTD